MTATTMTRETAKEEARARLPEVLAEVVPGFRPERPFRCLNPNHEDRHPSARYMNRTNTVRCFSCGWSGDVFDVVGAVYGLAGGEAFKKTYAMLGIDARGGNVGRRQPSRPRPANSNPETWQGVVDLIYPPGWDAVEEIELPLPLAVTAQAENGLIGRLLLSPRSVAVCREFGLKGWLFDDQDLGELYDDLSYGTLVGVYNPDFLDWLKAHAAPAHMVRKLARFVAEEGHQRKLEEIFASAHSHLLNRESPDMVMGRLLRRAEFITRRPYSMPEQADATAEARNLFERYMQNERLTSILARFEEEG